MARKKISTEMKAIIEQIPEEKRAIAARLADELIFMQSTLAALKQEIKDNGAIELFKNGSQEMLRESPALKSYNTTIQRYGTLYKQLTDLIPQQQEAQKANAVYDFIKEGLQ